MHYAVRCCMDVPAGMPFNPMHQIEQRLVIANSFRPRLLLMPDLAASTYEHQAVSLSLPRDAAAAQAQRARPCLNIRVVYRKFQTRRTRVQDQQPMARIVSHESLREKRSIIDPGPDRQAALTSGQFDRPALAGIDLDQKTRDMRGVKTADGSTRALQPQRNISMSSQPSPVSTVEQPGIDVQTSHWIDPLSDGTHILIRPLEAKDRAREFAFIKNLSPEARHFRFLSTIKEPSETLMNQLMDIDYRQRMAYVALTMQDGQLVEIGVARYAAADGDGQCEAAVVIADAWQRKGLGRRLMQHLIDAARINGFQSMMSMDSAANSPMHRLATDLGFECRQDPLDATQVIYRLKLED
jgi:GNAT superfamily N-acetyltransferase